MVGVEIEVNVNSVPNLIGVGAGDELGNMQGISPPNGMEWN